MWNRYGILLFTFFLLIIKNVWADPFISYPGTRAKAMGGAFVAVADDSSACWYNPAGLATEGLDITLEYSQAPKFNDNWEYSNKGKSIFGGIKIGTKDLGIGFFLYSPYHISWYFRVPDDSGWYDYLSGYLDETLYIYGWVLAFGNKFLKLGASLELIYLDFGDSEFYGEYTWGWNSTLDTENLSISRGYSASFGVLLHPIRVIDRGFDLKLGAVYHLPSSGHTTDYSLGYEETLADKVIFKKPASYDVGVLVGMMLGDFTYFSVAAQYGEIDYSTANEFLDWKYKRLAFGGELRIFLGKDMLISFRGGTYYSQPSKDYIGKVSGITGGVGLGIGHFILETSFEKRTWESPYNNTDDVINLMSFSINWSF